jgi:hypothetical protein
MMSVKRKAMPAAACRGARFYLTDLRSPGGSPILEPRRQGEDLRAMKNELDVVRDVSARLDRADISYMLTGSMAMNY